MARNNGGGESQEIGPGDVATMSVTDLMERRGAAKPFSVGQRVVFGGQGGALGSLERVGTVEGVNPKTIAVLCDTGEILKVRRFYVSQLDPSDPRFIGGAQHPRDRFSKGDVVKFAHKGQTVRAKVDSINRRSLSVCTEKGEWWTVGFSTAEKIDAAEFNPVDVPSINEAHRVGDRVVFEGRRKETITGTVRHVNIKTLSIEADDGRRWRVAPTYIRKPAEADAARPAPSPQTTAPAPQGLSGRVGAQYAVGDAVEFVGRRGATVRGRVERINEKTVSVMAEDGRGWRVNPRLLTKTDRQKLDMSQADSRQRRFGIGDAVCFEGRDGKVVMARVTKINTKTVGVVLDGSGQAGRISPALLRPAPDKPAHERDATEGDISPR